MTRIQSQLADPKVHQFVQGNFTHPMQLRSLPTAQLKSVQSMQPAIFGPNGTCSAFLFSTTLYAILVLLVFVAGSGGAYRIFLTGTKGANRETTERADVPIYSYEATRTTGEGEAEGRRQQRETDRSEDEANPEAPSSDRQGLTDDLDDEFLPPQERLFDYVHTNGGRIYQQELVEAMDRSASTVSRYLSKLESDGRIVRLRDRRRNIVLVPDGEYDWSWELSTSKRESGKH